MLIFIYCAVAIIGLCLGSFATALAWRAPRGLSWVQNKDQKLSRSQCPLCEHPLYWYDLIPFFSWAFGGGRCRYCKGKIHWRYPLIELSTMLLALLTVFLGGLTLLVLIILCALPFVVALIVTDFEFYLLPDSLTLPLFILGVAYALIQAFLYAGVTMQAAEYFLPHVVGGVLYSFLAWGTGQVMKLILKKDALGFGDVKFFGIVGMWLGISFLPVFLVLSGVLGLVIGAFYLYVLKKQPFPFGPALILSFLLCLFYTLLGSHFSYVNL